MVEGQEDRRALLSRLVPGRRRVWELERSGKPRAAASGRRSELLCGSARPPQPGAHTRGGDGGGWGGRGQPPPLLHRAGTTNSDAVSRRPQDAREVEGASHPVRGTASPSAVTGRRGAPNACPERLCARARRPGHPRAPFLRDCRLEARRAADPGGKRSAPAGGWEGVQGTCAGSQKATTETQSDSPNSREFRRTQSGEMCVRRYTVGEAGTLHKLVAPFMERWISDNVLELSPGWESCIVLWRMTTMAAASPLPSQSHSSLLL
ncbi:uncharacterized protein LOC121492540 [Vulpes lagopus]|uniref:uncharacterized protein LOC121492540 n=1 Tax=Vulpes lagopus TaxID=494514 RepID=UPI001BC9FBE5|nr:uncharacterized protein LOC121492540 [Vulpes lagopus]